MKKANKPMFNRHIVVYLFHFDHRRMRCYNIRLSYSTFSPGDSFYFYLPLPFQPCSTLKFHYDKMSRVPLPNTLVFSATSYRALYVVRSLVKLGCACLWQSFAAVCSCFCILCIKEKWIFLIFGFRIHSAIATISTIAAQLFSRPQTIHHTFYGGIKPRVK